VKNYSYGKTFHNIYKSFQWLKTSFSMFLMKFQHVLKKLLNWKNFYTVKIFFYMLRKNYFNGKENCSIVKIFHFIEKLNMFELCEKWKEKDFEESLHVFWLSTFFKICVQKINKKWKIKIWKKDLVKINKKSKIKIWKKDLVKICSVSLFCKQTLTLKFSLVAVVKFLQNI